MKKHYLIIPVILALIIAIPTVSRAEDGQGDNSSNTGSTSTESVSVDPISVESTSSVDTIESSSTRDLPRPPKMGLKDIFKNEAKTAMENIKNNQDVRRETAVEKISQDGKKIGADLKAIRGDMRNGSSSEVRGDIQNLKRDARDEIRNASSSEARREIRNEMRHDIFKIKFDSVLRQLNVSINNIKQIRDRISGRIQKIEASGKDMTSAKASLAIADSKISIAESAISDLASFTPATTTPDIASTTSTSTEATGVSLERPRQLGETAIKAVKSAKDSLIDVVKTIAKDMGVKLGEDNNGDKNASSTESTTSSSTNQ